MCGGACNLNSTTRGTRGKADLVGLSGRMGMGNNVLTTQVPTQEKYWSPGFSRAVVVDFELV